jgi:hypothetical protein
MLRKAILYYYTLRYLKWKQIRYQLWYRFRKFYRSFVGQKYDYYKNAPSYEKVSLTDAVDHSISYLGNNHFLFLNIDHKFQNKIDWDLPLYGKLWTYNLNYFEFLNQSDSHLYKDQFYEIMSDFIYVLPKLKNANEPFPTSLRVINWIKYFIKNENIGDQFLLSLYNQLYILDDNKEFHLMGNHLLENGFALVFGGVFFQDEYLFQQGKNILTEQLEEQILNDGAHFELSPMYHCLMLHRVLDILNLLRKNSILINKTLGDQNQFVTFIKSKALIMTGWLAKIMYKDGTIPHFNDSADGIALEPKKLLNYAQLLALKISAADLNDSGFRKLKNENFDIIIKAGNIGPDYIPGHAHADSLSFECRIDDQPFIVDTGISTYEKNERRLKERSTIMHNTVNIKGVNSSDVWDGFRVGKRTKTVITEESDSSLFAFHNGYSQTYSRSFVLSETYFTITESIKINDSSLVFHFHPSVLIEIKDRSLIGNKVVMSFEGAKEIILSEYQYCLGFNKVINARKAIVIFDNNLITRFTI